MSSFLINRTVQAIMDSSTIQSNKNEQFKALHRIIIHVKLVILHLYNLIMKIINKSILNRHNRTFASAEELL